jgi:5-methylcytosine-specific restriction endonuclease McrA
LAYLRQAVLVRFDMQKLRHPDIEGKEYQQGTLAGFETREFLLEKWNRECAYCGAKGIQLQIEHIHPQARGGSNSITNLIWLTLRVARSP